jgi:hypothetical protein
MLRGQPADSGDSRDSGCSGYSGVPWMTDVVLVATIVVFFVAAALLVQVLDRMIAGSGDELDPDEEEAEAARPEPGRSRPS